jgi:hypothetical protein
MRSQERNIRRVFELATAEELAAGMEWYPKARAEIAELALSFDLSREVVSAVVAVLSPNTRWEYTLRDAEAVSRGYRAGLSADQVTVTTYPANKFKAFELLRTQDTGIVNTRNGYFKVWSFADNLSNPESEAVTVDFHAYSIAMGSRFKLDDKMPAIKGNRYKRVAEAYRKVAAELGIRPFELQAVTWVTWHRLQEIKTYKLRHKAAEKSAANLESLQGAKHQIV